MIGDHHLFQDVAALVEQWRPQEAYDSELEFRDNLKEYLDVELNERKQFDLDVFTGRRERPVSPEHGQIRVDIAVDATVAIELKRAFENQQKKKLRGQIEYCLEHYPYTIVCACGITDMDGWRDLKNKYQTAGGMGMGLDLGANAGTVEFIHKRESEFGTSERTDFWSEGTGSDPLW